MTHPELGVIEGYYGTPWSWDERADAAAFLARRGYRFYLYAPKADPWLRPRWREPHPDVESQCIAGLAEHCRALGVRFGVGLSPAHLHQDFGGAAKESLATKLAALDALGIQDLALLFDDMRGDTITFKGSLADSQAEIVGWAAERTAATRVFVCPSYYSDDPVLDRVFGARPARYLERLGEVLDPAVQLFWTGEEVCSRELTPGHVDRVAEQMRRRPFLWDNYPVNDGARMSQFLHVRGFTGRPGALARHVAGHGINPALQPTLTRIPALTLVDSYALGERAIDLRNRYAAHDHPGAREVIAWLDGAYRITDALVREQAGEGFTG